MWITCIACGEKFSSYGNEDNSKICDECQDKKKKFVETKWFPKPALTESDMDYTRDAHDMHDSL